LKLPDLDKGDVLMAGKWKNKKCVIDDFDTDDNGQPVAKQIVVTSKFSNHVLQS
jgi:hypothetical protein